ncbi:MFS transporter [Roseateles sp.]|uniref:MFS transporter n=1 Tax=Roseateles sp. TaxID=1971397 RepID=UPI0031DE0980
MSAMPFPSEAAVPPREPLRVWLLAWYGLAVLVATSVLAAVDRQILVLLAEPIRQSLNLSDTKLGLLQGVGIALFAGLAAVPLGGLADRYGRKPVLAGCVLLWTAATAACGMAWDFPSLFIAAIGLGIGEAGLAPVVYGMIPDIVPPSRRVLANGIFALASILGAGLGISLSGAMIGSIDAIRPLLPAALAGLEAWRLSFFVVAIPGPLMALLIVGIRIRSRAVTTVTPPATPDPLAAHTAAPVHEPAITTLREYFRGHARTALGIFGGAGLGSLGIQALGAWAPVLAARKFGATAQEVGQGFGAAYMIGTLAGAALGAVAVKLLRPRTGAATPVRVLGAGTGLAALVCIALPWATSALQIYLLFGVQVVCLIAGTVVAPTILQDISPPALRSRVIAMGTVIATLLGAASPVLVGLVSDALSAHAGALALSVAIVASTSMAVGALLTRWSERHFVRTVAALDAHAPTSSATAASPSPHHP